MSIVTKTGDKGETSLLSGERVPKDNLRVEAYGTLDELNSFLGDAKHYCSAEGFPGIIETVQSTLFRVCAELASESGGFENSITESEVDLMNQILTSMEEKMDLKGFVLPGNSPGSARLDICRSIARRGERRIISLSGKKKVDQTIIKYINRLSDLLFIMARIEEKTHRYVK